MTNVEIYDTSNSELSSDEYSHEEDDDALMEAAVSKQASPGSTPIKAGVGAVAKPKSKPSGNRDDESLAAADAAGKDQTAEDAAVVVQEPPSTRAEAIRCIRRMQEAPYKHPFVFLKRRSFLWLKCENVRDDNYRFQIKRNRVYLRRKRYSSYSRSVSYSRSNSRSPSPGRSRSRSLERTPYSSDRSRSVSHSPELICLDDTENEDSPEKPEEAKAENVTPIKENKANIIKPPPPAQPQLEQLEVEKSNENGTSSVLAEFLMIKEANEPSQAAIELNKLTASLELEEAIPDTTLVQHEEEVQEAAATAEEPMAVDATLKRRRSVTPPKTNEKSRIVDDDDDTIEYLPAVAQNLVTPTPVLKMQPSELTPKAAPFAPTANPIQSQPAFKLSSPYTLAPHLPGPNAKQNINLAALSHSLNTPTPPAVPMEIAYPTENFPHITKSNLVMPLPEQQASSVAVSVFGSPPYTAELQWPPTPHPAPAHADIGSQHDIAAQSNPPRSVIPLQSVASGALQAPFATQRVLPAQVDPPRAQVPLQVNSPRATAPPQLPADPPRPTVSRQTATPLRRAPPPQQQQQPPTAQVQQEQQTQVAMNVTSFAVPQQPQPRRSETVSTQTPQPAQPESSPSKSAIPDLKNSEANFHYRLKELFPNLDTILKEKLDSVGPDPKSVIEEIDADVKTLDNLLAEKEDQWNRLFHLRCMKMELRGRVERMERMSIIKKLLPSVAYKGCSTAELCELQESLFGKHMLKLPLMSGPSPIEQCLNSVEVSQSEIQQLRDVLGLKAKQPAAPAAFHSHLEERQQQHQQQRYNRNSMPGYQSMLHELQDMKEGLEPRDRDCDLPPVNKRPRLSRTQDRYAHEMTNSTSNLATPPFRNKLTVPGKQAYYSQTSSALENFLETDSQVRPLYNSSPMVSQRNLANRQYDDLHSTSSRNQEEENVSEFCLKKSQSRRDSSISNGKEVKVCQHCRFNEAIYVCTSCLNQWYCSSKCQLFAWDSHRKYCGK